MGRKELRSNIWLFDRRNPENQTSAERAGCSGGSRFWQALKNAQGASNQVSAAVKRIIHTIGKGGILHG
jgi:hypothetical protein